MNCIFQRKVVRGNKTSYSCGNPTCEHFHKKCLDCNLKREHKCRFLRSSKRGHFCSSKNKYIELIICDTCDGREHNRIKEFIATAKAVIQEPKLSTEVDKRLAVCSQCSHKRGGACKVCGCNLNTKVQFQAAHCPLNKW